MPATQPALPHPFRAGLAAAGILLLLLAGCGSLPQGSGPASVDRAERLLKQGNAAAAAQMYEELANGNPPPARNDLALAATRAWLTANRADDAQRALDLANAGNTPAQQFERELLRAEVGVARGQYGPAWQQISQVPEPRDAPSADRLFQLQQQVALRAGQPIEAVRAGISRERVATNDTGRTRARRELLSDLRAALDRGLRIDPASARDAQVRGWLELGQIAATAGRSPLSADAAVTRWRSRFPGHPGATIVDSEILNPGARTDGIAALSANEAPVALLLPLTGQYALQAGLVRDGFMAAVARLPEADRPAVRVYDTGTQPVSTALQNARIDGAGFIVGPLSRDEVQTAFEQRPNGVPMLLLNALAGGGIVGSQVYQYLLAPEDEARQIARQMATAGQRNVLVLSPTGDWGQRVSGAFADELTQAGGRVVAQQLYTDISAALTNTITTAVGIDESRRRHTRLQQVTGATLQFDARPRPDIDAVFVAGWQSLTVRQINPLLRHYIGDSMPIYTTQEALAADALANRDLDGMRLVDMPWMLDTVGPVADLRAATEAQWGPRGARQSRYFAFGYDAATLAVALRRGRANWPLPGLTGRLQLTPDGRIERGSLNWARLREGALQPFDPLSR